MVWVGWLIMGCTCPGFIRARRTPSRLLSPRMALITARMAKSFSQTGIDMSYLPIHCRRRRKETLICDLRYTSAGLANEVIRVSLRRLLQSKDRLLALFALWLIPAALLHSQPVINTLAG